MSPSPGLTGTDDDDDRDVDLGSTEVQRSPSSTRKSTSKLDTLETGTPCMGLAKQDIRTQRANGHIPHS